MPFCFPRLRCAALAAAVAVAAVPALAQPIGTAFTYQGFLQDGGLPANGPFDLEVRLFDAAGAGVQQGPALTLQDVAVDDGLFTVALDFGGVFGGNARFLQIAVRPGASTGAFTPLAGRQELKPAPYAVFAQTAAVALNAGDMTGVAAGAGLTGGGTSGDVTLAADFGGNGTAQTLSRSDHTHFGQNWSGSQLGAGLVVQNTDGDGLRGFTTVEFGGQGVLGQANSANTSGVRGQNQATTGSAAGVTGVSTNSPNGRGVVGTTNGTATNAFGVLGISAATNSGGAGVLGSASSPGGFGVLGDNASTTSFSVGVRGQTASTAGSGVYGTTSATTGNTIGVFAVKGPSPTGFAAILGGASSCTGTFSKAGGAFKIDHPLDPARKYLYHSFVESPDMKNVYDGVVVLDDAGQATIAMPDWFEALNRDFRYQLTTIGGFAPVYVAEELKDGRFRIGGGRAGLKVSWQLTGIRQDVWADKNRIPVEQDKPDDEMGTYLHPEERGLSPELSLIEHYQGRGRKETVSKN